MKKLYEKSPIWFAVTWIAVYVVGAGIADGLSTALETDKSVTFPFLLLLTGAAVLWLWKTGLLTCYGLCKPILPAARFGYYLPLILLSTVNFWCGIRLQMPAGETLLYVGSMLCVGFLEELIFRGFLFKAMAKDSLRVAVILSSLTFGFGHMVNLINGSGAGLAENLCQVCSAVAFGFLFVVIFHRGGSLLPCILAHSAINAGSAFSNDAAMTGWVNVAQSAVLCAVATAYALLLHKTPPPAPTENP